MSRQKKEVEEKKIDRRKKWRHAVNKKMTINDQDTENKCKREMRGKG